MAVGLRVQFLSVDRQVVQILQCGLDLGDEFALRADGQVSAVEDRAIFQLFVIGKCFGFERNDGWFTQPKLFNLM